MATKFEVPWKKLLLMLFLMAIVAIPLLIAQRTRSANQAVVTAIQSSTLFNKMTIEAFRGSKGEWTSAEALTLRDAGYLLIEEETIDVPARGFTNNSGHAFQENSAPEARLHSSRPFELTSV